MKLALVFKLFFVCFIAANVGLACYIYFDEYFSSTDYIFKQPAPIELLEYRLLEEYDSVHQRITFLREKFGSSYHDLLFDALRNDSAYLALRLKLPTFDRFGALRGLDWLTNRDSLSAMLQDSTYHYFIRPQDRTYYKHIIDREASDTSINKKMADLRKYIYKDIRFNPAIKLAIGSSGSTSRSWFSRNHGLLFCVISLMVVIGVFFPIVDVVNIGEFLGNLKVFSALSQGFGVTPFVIKSKFIKVNFDIDDFELLASIAIISFLCFAIALILHQIGKNFKVNHQERDLVDAALRKQKRVYKSSLMFTLLGCSTILFYTMEILYFILK